MNNHQNGNVIIVVAAAIAIIMIIYSLFTYDLKIEERNSTNLPSQLIYNLSESTNNPISKPDVINGDGLLSWTSKVDITESPFSHSTDDFLKNFKFSTQLQDISINDDLKEHIPKNTYISNIFSSTPNGYGFPNKSNFLDGYAYNHDEGTLIITFDNFENRTDLMIYLFRVSDLFSNSNSKPSFSRAIYVKNGDKFVINDLISGIYSIRWVQLDSGKSFEYGAFRIYKDNKYNYNRYFRFNDTNNQNVKNISINAFYAKEFK